MSHPIVAGQAYAVYNATEGPAEPVFIALDYQVAADYAAAMGGQVEIVDVISHGWQAP